MTYGCWEKVCRILTLGPRLFSDDYLVEERIVAHRPRIAQETEMRLNSLLDWVGSSLRNRRPVEALRQRLRLAGRPAIQEIRFKASKSGSPSRQ